MASEVIREKIPFRPIKANATTADGNSQLIVGKLRLNVEYSEEKKTLDIYIVPSLKQNLYLEIDFWKLFDIFPEKLRVAEIETRKHREINLHQHDLSTYQQSQLQTVVNCFPSFAQEGLGKTNLITHTIDVGNAKPVKQRHFPVSPAVEKEVYAEIDRMLSLGVIEESDSAWSSPIVMVTRKS